jgi:hypothetical protein
MHRFAPAVFAVALGQAIVVPPPLTAQHRAALTVGVTTAARNHESRRPAESSGRLSPRPWPDADSTAKKLSLKHHMLVGAGVGAVAGYAIGVYSRNNSSECYDCFCCPSWTIPVFGAVAGAAVGTVIGWFVYLDRISPAAP